MLKQTHDDNIIISVKEYGYLREISEVLGPFAEATDFSQGDKTVTISCMVPTVLSLHRILESKQSTGSLAKTLLQSSPLPLQWTISESGHAGIQHHSKCKQVRQRHVFARCITGSMLQLPVVT